METVKAAFPELEAAAKQTTNSLKYRLGGVFCAILLASFSLTARAQVLAVAEPNAGVNMSATTVSAVARVDKAPVAINMEAFLAAVDVPQNLAEGEGRVLTRLLVDKEGNVLQAIAVSYKSKELANAIISQISNLKFQPARLGTQEVATWVSLPFNLK